MIILDSNVVSALMKSHEAEEISAWLDTQSFDSIWITAISILEIRSGILRLPAGRRKDAMLLAFSNLSKITISGRVLPFDADAADAAAVIAARRIDQGLNIATLDTQIGGICVSRSATLATRNTRHFADLGIPLVNPWHA